MQKFRKLFCGFCNQTESISTFYELKNIMNPPTPENFQRLLLTVQQMIKSNPINWKFMHRIQLLEDQFNLGLDIPNLLSRLKDQTIDPYKQQFVIDIMQSYFRKDEELFKDLFNQLLRMDEILFTTQLKMLQTYYQYPEFFDQDKVLPKLIQNMIVQEDLESYDLVSALEVFSYSPSQLTEKNRQLLQDLKEKLNQQVIKIIPALGQRQYRELIINLRSKEYYNEELKQAVFQYFHDNKEILGQSTLLELLNLCNLNLYINDDLKYQILIQINFLKVNAVNESKLIKKIVLPSAEQEMMANLITLSGIQLDREYIDSHFIGSNSQKREQLIKLERKDGQISQIVQQILRYIDGQFNTYLNVIQTIQTFELLLPELLQPMIEELKRILTKQVVGPTDLLSLLNYFDSCNILFDEQDQKGMEQFQNYLNQDYFSYQKIDYLQRQFAYKRNQDKMRELLDQSYNSAWTLELCSRQVLLYEYFNIPLSQAFKDKFQSAIEDYVLKKRSQIEQIQFYKCIVQAKWEKNLKQEHMNFYNEGQIQSQRTRREQTKNLRLSSFLEQEITNDILQYMPKTFILQSNQYMNGMEIDIVITNQKGEKLYFQIHGQTHFYHASTIYNYKTLLETFYLEKLGKHRAINYYETEAVWKSQREKAVEKLLKCLM
ncbi:unnamed protein product (macronuclear) [Paramecium tetraurelia]|uniref:RAP domain-containing protein n=1 Tax=Paramecium tetraurelia TaxID=5888 RepID=A0E8K8_PARTE|nr:uncharacterized protein GSPATT00024354001 [Paramecium tetraurelia]CAK91625.1 unnamed protein product [Paramecium tetraurelia]|eukprot:XP_001459022.1 hypothetical protein (macronuclear) [Paramecium tetraurelia strain d4-2]